MTSEQLSYIAGLVDGEGTITIQKRKSKGCINPSFMGYVKIFNTDKRMVDWVLKVIGQGSVNTYTTSGGRKPIHQWAINDRQAEEFLYKIYPFLVIKKEQSEIYFKFRKSFKKQYPRGTPPELIAERTKYFEEIKMLHL